MKLQDLLDVLDVDTNINIKTTFKDIYEGKAGDYIPNQEILKDVKAVWYSKIYNAIMIDL